jgi:hypothetical protein
MEEWDVSARQQDAHDAEQRIIKRRLSHGYTIL